MPLVTLGQLNRVVSAVDVSMMTARSRVSEAALACLRGSGDAAQRVAAALEAIDAARGSLRTLQDVTITNKSMTRR